MQHPKDIRRPHPGVHQAKVDARLDVIEANVANIRNNFVGHVTALETKVKQLEDRARTQRLENEGLLIRLDSFEKKLDSIMHGADVRNHRYYKLEEDYNRQLSKCAVTQATIKAIEEKLNGID